MSRRIVSSDLSLSPGGEGGGGGTSSSTQKLSLTGRKAPPGAETSSAMSTAVPPPISPPPQPSSTSWMSTSMPQASSSSPVAGPALLCSAAVSCSPSVNLSLSPSSSDPRSPPEAAAARLPPVHQAAALAKLCMELEEGRQAWAQHRKEATWRLSRLEQQLESEKARKRKEVFDDVEAKIRCLREEETAFLERLEAEYRDQLSSIQREAEGKEAKIAESWTARHAKLARLAEQVAGASSAAAAGNHHFTMPKHLH